MLVLGGKIIKVKFLVCVIIRDFIVFNIGYDSILENAIVKVLIGWRIDPIRKGTPAGNLKAGIVGNFYIRIELCRNEVSADAGSRIFNRFRKRRYSNSAGNTFSIKGRSAIL